MDRRLLLAVAFVPVAFYAWACGGDDEQPPADPGPSSSSGGSSSGDTSSSGNTSSSGGQGDSGDPDGGAVVCPGNPLSEDAGTGDGGAVVSSDAGAVTLIVTANANFLDGPVYSDLFDGGALVYSEVFNQRIMRVAPTGGAGVELRAAPGTPARMLPIGNAGTDAGILTVIATPPAGNTGGQTPGIITTLPDGGAGPKIDVPNTITNPNDLVVGPGGVVFFTDPAYQSGSATRGAYRVNPGGDVESVKDGGYPGENPDGIALSPDGTILYVAMGGTGKRIDRFTVGANGATTVANPATLQAQYIDDLEGIAVDTGGNVWVTESVRPVNADNPANGGRVEVFAPDGTKHGEIVFPDHRPINVAFGGADNKTVYIVANRNANAGGGGSANYSGFIFTFTTRCAGVR
jgi:gluconolactonase